MNKVTMKQLYDVQAEFIRRHEIDKIETSPMENNSYSKHYISEDGSEMWEFNRIVTEKVEVEVKGIKAIAEIKLWETECWSTEFPSMYLYQQA